MGKTEPKSEQEKEPQLEQPATPENDTDKDKKLKAKKEKLKKRPIKTKSEGEKAVDVPSETVSEEATAAETTQKAEQNQLEQQPEKSVKKKREKSTDVKEPKPEQSTPAKPEAPESSQPETVDSSQPNPTSVGSQPTVAGNSASGSTSSLTATGPKEVGDIVFIDELDAMYRCISCGQALRVPILFEDCGHRCCSGCLPNVLRGSSRCPSDNTNLKQDHIRMDKEFQLRMDNLGVRCTFCASGCPWTGKLAQLGSHLSHCGYRVIVCPNGCGVEFEQRYVEQHLTDDCPKRSKKCKFCEATLMAANELKHIGVCPKFPVSCPNGCKVHEIPRSQLTEHLTTECTKQELPCPFAQHGCKFRGRKKKMDPHVQESSLEHLTLVNSSMQQMSVLLEAQTKSFSELKHLLAQQTKRIAGLERCFGAAFTWKIDNYTEKFNLAKSGKQTTIFSPPFYTHRCGYRMVMSVCLYGSGDARGKFMSVFACLCRGDHDTLLPWPFTHQITFTMMDQHLDIAMRKPIDYTIKPNPTPEQNLFLGRPTGERNACFGAPRFVKLETLKTSDYVVDDNLFLKLSLNLEDLSPL